MEGNMALVTGAGKGIGRGIALALAEAGYDVAVNYNRSRSQAEEVAAEIERLGRKAVLLQADVTQPEAIQEMFARFQTHFSHIDLLVNNSGITRMAPFLETTPEMFDEVIHTDLRGVYFCAQAAARLMVRTGKRGTIVNISSNHAIGCWPNSTVYAAAKAGVNKLTMNMALDLSEHGIRVAGIAPGYTQLEWHTPEQIERYVKATAGKIPAGRFATTGEIGKAVVFLASPHASYITGTTLYIDGGALLPVVADNRFGG